MGNVINLNEVEELSKQLHISGKEIVVAGGCFDLLHIGHITLLGNAKKQADILMVLLESDKAIEEKKGINRPIHSQRERAQLLKALKVVDYVILLNEDMDNADYDKLLEAIKPSIIATTEHDTSLTHKERQAKLVGAKVVMVNKYVPSVSTSKLLTIITKEI